MAWTIAVLTGALVVGPVPATETAAPAETAAPTASAPAAPSAEVAEAIARAEAAAEAGDDAAALDAYREAYGRTTKADVAVRRDLLHGIGKTERRRFERDHDPATLRRAEAALTDAASRCTTAGEPICDAIAADLHETRDRLAGVDNPAAPPTDPVTPQGPASTGPAPPSAPVAIAPTPAAVAPPTPIDPAADDRRELRTADNLATAGYVFLGIGGGTLVILSLPAIIAAAIAQDRSESDPFFASQSELQDRAARRRRFAFYSALVGGGFAVLGGAFVAAGLGKKAAIKKRSQLAVTPVRGGASAVLRVTF